MILFHGVFLFALLFFLKGVYLSDQSVEDVSFDISADIDFVTADPGSVLGLYMQKLIPKLPDGYLLNDDIKIKDFCEFVYSEWGSVYAAENFYEIFYPQSPIFFCDVSKIPAAIFLSIPSLDEIISDCYASMSNEFVSVMINHLSLSNRLNLSSFHEKLHLFTPDSLIHVHFPFLLPHLIDFSAFTENSSLELPERFLKCPEDFYNASDIFIWNISTQLLLFHLFLQADSFQSSLVLPKLLNERANAIQRAKESNSVEILRHLNTNFMDPSFLDRFPVGLEDEFFGVPQPLSNTLTLSEIFSEFKLIDPLVDVNHTGYSELSVRNQILYRTMVYLCILTNSSEFISISNGMLSNLVTKAHAGDFTEIEMYFFVKLCIHFNLVPEIAAILRSSPSSRFTETFWDIVASNSSDNEEFTVLKGLIDHSADVADNLQFLLYKHDSDLQANNFKQIVLKDEDRFLNLQTERAFAVLNSNSVVSSSTAAAVESTEIESQVDGHESPLVRTYRLNRMMMCRNQNENESFNAKIRSDILKDHFISPTDFVVSISSLKGTAQPQIERTFTIDQLPNRRYASDRVNNFLQNLADADFGEMKWREVFEAGGYSESLLENEKTLEKFVQSSIKVVYFASQQHPASLINVLFEGNAGFGNGLFTEMMNMLAELIILPKFNVLIYNPKLAHFVPSPLLHKEMMGILGFIMGWFLKHQDIINWSLAPTFTQFLFYEENTKIPMKQLVKSLYSPIFDELKKWSGPDMFDYLPSTFHTNLPFALSKALPATPFNILSPGSDYQPMSSYMTDDNDSDSTTNINPSSQLNSISDTQVDDPIEVAFSNYISVLEALIKDELLLGRFYFIRQFYSFFHQPALPFLDHRFFLDLMKKQKVSDVNCVTIDRLLPGLIFDSIKEPIQILDKFGQDYTPEEALIAILKSFPTSSAKLQEFYRFCTGCYRLPIGGLASNPIRISPSNDTEKFPVAHTCFRQLVLHLRPTLESLASVLSFAIENSEGFDLEEVIEEEEE